jgi:hypothetical protein
MQGACGRRTSSRRVPRSRRIRDTPLAGFEHKTLCAVTAGQKHQILQLAGDFPRLWTAPTTAARDRKRMLRVLIKDITVAKGPELKQLRLQIR